jgi:hypothetical protein
MYTSSDLYGKETHLEHHRKDILDIATRNRSLHPSRLDSPIIPENNVRYQALVYRLAYGLLLALIITFLVVEAVTAVSGAWSGGGGGGIYLVR